MPRLHYPDLSPGARGLLADMISQRRERNALVARLMLLPGGLVLAHHRGRADGSPMGALVTPSIEQPGGWRVTHFDADGFLGHTTHASRLAAIQEAVRDGYRTTDRDLLRRLWRQESFRRALVVAQH